MARPKEWFNYGKLLQSRAGKDAAYEELDKMSVYPKVIVKERRDKCVMRPQHISGEAAIAYVSDRMRTMERLINGNNYIVRARKKALVIEQSLTGITHMTQTIVIEHD